MVLPEDVKVEVVSGGVVEGGSYGGRHSPRSALRTPNSENAFSSSSDEEGGALEG